MRTPAHPPVYRRGRPARCSCATVKPAVPRADAWGERTSTPVTLLIAILLLAFSGWLAVRAEFVEVPWYEPQSQGDVKTYGPLFVKPDAYENEFLSLPWVRNIKVGNSTFARVLPNQARLSIEGRGPLSSRTVTAQTAASARLFRPRARRQRSTQFVHDMLDHMEERRAYVRGVAFSTSDDGFVASYLATVMQTGAFNYAADSREARAGARYVVDYAKARRRDGMLAYYEFHSTWVVLGPEVSKLLELHLKKPGSITKRQGLLAAHVLRHEIEHAVTATNRMQEREGWMEEASAEVIAAWPGEAARTAEAVGVPFPPAARDRSLEQLGMWIAYEEQVKALREVLKLAGLDHTRKADFAAADKLLQQRPVEHVEDSLAAAIADHRGLDEALERRLAARIARVDGSHAEARRLAADVRRGRI